MSVDGAFHKDIRRQKNASLRQTFVTRKDKYLRYWEMFAKATPGIRRVWYCITCVCLLLVWPIFIFSMIIMSN